MNVKAIIVDLDRTLLRSDKTVSPYTTEVLRTCRERDISVMMATARPERTAMPYCATVDFDAMTVSNGVRVILDGRRANYGICLTTAEPLLRALQSHPSLRITLETGDQAYSNQPIEDYETVICDDLISVARREGVLKLLVHLDQKETLSIVENALTEDLYYTVAHGYLLQIMSRKATKWNGIQAMLEIGGYTPAEVAYFGDDNDDLEPIRQCGIGVAVSNGLDEVKAVADYVAEANDADGVAKFIEWRILNS
ncbi:MAG: HAD hydrolase family protein [Clostridia bacterium]|nr:HAD hydrolase family protein [Clostridia bacterium]